MPCTAVAGESPASSARPRPAPDPPCPAKQDVTVVRPADVAHRLEAIRHVIGVGGILVASAPETVNPFAAPFKEHLKHVLADAQLDVAWPSGTE